MHARLSLKLVTINIVAHVRVYRDVVWQDICVVTQEKEGNFIGVCFEGFQVLVLYFFSVPEVRSV
jgi:hypothetical protein